MDKRLRKAREQCRWWRDRVRGAVVGRDLVLWRVTPLGYPLRVVRLCWDQGECAVLAEALQEGAEMLLKKAELPAVATIGPKLAKDAVAQQKWPLLWAHMTQTTWDDGTARLTSSVVTFFQDGVCKAMLRDPNAGLCLWAACDSLSGVFGVLDALLGDPAADWRVDRRAPGQAAKRVKRT